MNLNQISRLNLKCGRGTRKNNIRLYKKNEEKNINEAFMMIKHISKPISIVID